MFKKIILSALSPVLLLASFTLHAELVVIAHPSMADTLTQNNISKIFLGKTKKFPGGASAIPLNLPEANATRQAFDSTVLKKSPQQIKSYWSKQIFTGKGQPPRVEDSSAAVIGLVKDNPNIIGYIDASEVTADVKVVARF